MGSKYRIKPLHRASPTFKLLANIIAHTKYNVETIPTTHPYKPRKLNIDIVLN